MPYREFTLEDLKHNFGLQVNEKVDYFANASPVAASRFLQDTLRDLLPLALAISTEKARSEMIIAPVLIEVWRYFEGKVSLFSGVEFNVDPAQGLNGVCDFLFSLSPTQLAIEAPVAVVVEAKNEDMRKGIFQCIAEMVAAQLYNRQRQNGIETVYGAVTTGNNWKFLRLTGTVAFVDATEYYIKDVERIVGIMVSMLKEAQQAQLHAA
ncbi:MAG: hypothetical protein L0Z62_44965 [Gemmataceae bacterium]|nr:hypothetical protein [Gemmataceae bacterium]